MAAGKEARRRGLQVRSMQTPLRRAEQGRMGRSTASKHQRHEVGEKEGQRREKGRGARQCGGQQVMHCWGVWGAPGGRRSMISMA